MHQKKEFIQNIKENEGIIYKVARIYSNNVEDQKDLYQEIVYQLWKSYESFKGDSKISTWMYRVALNTSITHLKKEKRNDNQVPIDSLLLNKSELETSIAYFEIIKHKFDSIRSTLLPEDLNAYYYGSEKFSVSDLGKWNGLMVAEFEETSFQAIQISGIIKEFDIELIRDISKVYRLQEITNDAGDSILEKLMSINSSTKVLDVIIMFRLITNDLLITQKRLLVDMEKLSLKL